MQKKLASMSSEELHILSDRVTAELKRRASEIRKSIATIDEALKASSEKQTKLQRVRLLDGAAQGTLGYLQ